MSMTTFAELEKSPESQKVVLVEIEPSICVTSWTLESGNTYKSSFPKKPYSDGKVSRVREDASTWYTEETSIPSVEANPGSFWYDGTNEILYIHTSDSANPSTHTICVYFWLYFANETKKPLTVGSAPLYFMPLVKGVPSLKRTYGSVEKMGADTWSIGTLRLSNGQRADGTGPFDETFYDYIWFGALVKFRVGGEALPYSEYKQAATLIIRKVRKNFEELSFTLSDLRTFLKKKLPQEAFSISTYPNLEQGKDGAPIPLAWGLTLGFTPTEIDTTAEQYQCASHRIIVLRAKDDGVDVGFTPDNANGKLTLKAAPVGTLTVDLVGLVGPNLLQNSSFESFTGTADDGVTDNFNNWSNWASGNSRVEAVTSPKLLGSYACMLHCQDAYGVSITQSVTLEADTWYRVAYYGKSDGNVESSVQIGRSGQYLQDDRSWSGTWNLVDALTITVNDTGDFVAVSIPFKSTTAGSYNVMIAIVSGVGDVWIDEVIVGEAYELYGEIAKDICDKHSDVDSGDYDATSFEDLDDDRPYPVGLIVDKRIEVDAIFTELDKSVCAHHEITREGKLRLKKWEGPDPADPDKKSYDKFVFKGMKEQISGDSLRWKVDIGYGHEIQEDKWNFESASDTGTRYKYRTQDEEEIPTLLAYKQDATAVAGLYLDLMKALRLDVDLRAQLRPLYSDLGNTVSLDKARFNKDTAADLQVVSIEEHWDTNRNEVLLNAFKFL